MRPIARVVLAAVAVLCLPVAAMAKVQITIDLDTQTMHVESQDHTYDWKVSSGASGYDTPPGNYGVLWTDKDHKSDEYDGAPMPNAIFFKPGFAIHGAYKSNWGHPASHGCVRLPVAKSAILYGLVQAEGAEIHIVGGDPDATVATDGPRRREANPVLDADRAVVAPAAAGTEDNAYGYGYGAPAESGQPMPSAPPRSRPSSPLDALFGGMF